MSRQYTYARPKFIVDTVTSGEALAEIKSILVPNTAPSSATDTFIYNINIKRSNVDVTNKAIHFYNVNSGTVVVQTNSTDYVLTENDEITISGSYL